MRIRTTPPTHEQQQPPPQIGSDIKEEREEDREKERQRKERERDGIVGARASATGVGGGDGKTGPMGRRQLWRACPHTSPGPPPSAAPAMPSPVAACPYYPPVAVPTTLPFSRVCPPDSSYTRGFEKTRCVTACPFPPSVTFF
jgi:hypothetical protein